MKIKDLGIGDRLRRKCSNLIVDILRTNYGPYIVEITNIEVGLIRASFVPLDPPETRDGQWDIVLFQDQLQDWELVDQELPDGPDDWAGDFELEPQEQA